MTASAFAPPRAPAPARVSVDAIARARAAVAAADDRHRQRDGEVMSLHYIAEIGEEVRSLATSITEAAARRDVRLVRAHALELREEVVAMLREVKRFDRGAA
jgi:hypothetical protein